MTCVRPLRQSSGPEVIQDSRQRDADRVGWNIRPIESAPENQGAQTAGANRVDPGRMIQLAEFHDGRERESKESAAPHGNLRTDETNERIDHRSPKRVAAVLPQEEGKGQQVGPPAQAAKDDEECGQQIGRALAKER